MVNCDNQSALDLSKNATYYRRTKHIDMRYHWLRDIVNTKEIELKKIYTDNNVTDILTKVVTRDKHQLCSMAVELASTY